MSITAAERQVRIDRRRKKNAPRGRKQEALFRLKNSVTEALRTAAAANRKDPAHSRGTHS
jgi:hypothetical protein